VACAILASVGDWLLLALVGEPGSTLAIMAPVDGGGGGGGAAQVLGCDATTHGCVGEQ